ncbi:hypothetical protein EVAR_28658_1 [Eumeta japonica]|uniref:Uncharacterized protein n=1 Tax=Eumeta variegata TaxID=151549 RepID=A0A4C2A969_EUMVA|nr:hypothetical protein EVAR_28658_1 [Eumeta japonica]
MKHKIRYPLRAPVTARGYNWRCRADIICRPKRPQSTDDFSGIVSVNVLSDHVPAGLPFGYGIKPFYVSNMGGIYLVIYER